MRLKRAKVDIVYKIWELNMTRHLKITGKQIWSSSELCLNHLQPECMHASSMSIHIIQDTFNSCAFSSGSL